MNERVSVEKALQDEAEFAAQVNEALKEYDSVLALARLPLANSPLVTPLLVLDDVSPTAEERGQALRLLIRWAVERLAPAPVLYPFGTERPFDDPTWSDSRWWRYNILRHRYIEPIHPDDFVDGGRYTETLIALTGIPSTDTFFDERNRAIREVARWLQQQWISGQANDELQRLALSDVYRQLNKQRIAAPLLDIAATFDDVFPTQLLRQMALEERLEQLDSALTWLIQNRFLASGDNGMLLSLSTVLQCDLYLRQPPARLERRHRQIADWYLDNQNIVAAVRHRQKAGQWHEAATVLLQAANDLVNELQSRDLLSLLQQFPAHALPPHLWREVQIRLSDMLALTGDTEGAISACRRALKVSTKSSEQAHIYRRMGKLYEAHNQLHALNYYQQAFESFEISDPELVDLLKDRAWIYILREEWEAAELDLNLALAQLAPAAAQQKANVFDALSYLHGRRQQYTSAIQYARQALALREERGDIVRVADSFINLGLLYMRMGEYANALAAHHDGLKVYRQIDNRPKIATALLNIGMVYHLDQRLNHALASYQESLALCQEIGLPLVESKAFSNLVEAYMDAEQPDKAQTCWQQGFQLALEKGFADEVDYYEELRTRFPFLAAQEGAKPSAASPPTVALLSLPALTPDEALAIEFAQRHGQVTASDLIDELHLSRATATRRLASLVEKGYLQAEGKGRGSYYRLVTASQPQPTPPVKSLSLPTISAEEARARLASYRRELEQRFAIEALGIPFPTEPQPPASKLVVRFQQEPSLLRYFALRRQLSQILQQDVDLWVETESANTSQSRPVVWLLGE